MIQLPSCSLGRGHFEGNMIVQAEVLQKTMSIPSPSSSITMSIHKTLEVVPIRHTTSPRAPRPAPAFALQRYFPIPHRTPISQSTQQKCPFPFSELVVVSNASINPSPGSKFWWYDGGKVLLARTHARSLCDKGDWGMTIGVSCSLEFGLG